MGDLRSSIRLPFLVLFGLAWGVAGCNRQDADHLSHIGQKLAAGLGEVRGSLEVGWHGVVPAMGLEARVEARLYWDKALAGAAIEVKASGSEIELTGTVKDQTQQHRAVGLAEATSGVEKVVDNLQVESP
jgi:osmotically-inducible protein OsmY